MYDFAKVNVVICKGLRKWKSFILESNGFYCMMQHDKKQVDSIVNPLVFINLFLLGLVKRVENKAKIMYS